MRVFDQPFLTHEQEKTASVDLLVLSHGRLVVKMAKKFARYGVDIDELVQEGNVALVIAASKFEPERGFRFSTYAQYWITQRMRDLVMKLHSVVKVPMSRESKSTFFKRRPFHDVSLETPIPEDDRTFGDFLVSDDPSPDDLAEMTIDAETAATALRQAMRVLSPREDDIIRSRYLREKPETLDSIGARLGISKERVRQLQLAALAKLQKVMVTHEH